MDLSDINALQSVEDKVASLYPMTLISQCIWWYSSAPPPLRGDILLTDLAQWGSILKGGHNIVFFEKGSLNIFFSEKEGGLKTFEDLKKWGSRVEPM